MFNHADLVQKLKSGKLTTDDIKQIEQILVVAEKDQKGESIGGRPIVARLPHGMDVVK